MAKTYGLQPTSVKDCLDPEHLPKFEQFENYAFVIIRDLRRAGRANLRHGAGAHPQGGDLLRPVVPHHHPPHRAGLADGAAGEVRGRTRPASAGKEGLQAYVLTQVLNAAVDTYLQADGGDRDADRRLRGAGVRRAGRGQPAPSREDLRDIHVLKRQVTLIKRLLWRTLDVVQRMTPATRTRGHAVPGRPGERRELSLLRRRAARRRQHHPQCPARPGRPPHRRGHADPDGVLRVLPPAHVPRGRLRHELRLHARAALAVGLSGRARRRWAASCSRSISGSAGADGFGSEPRCRSIARGARGRRGGWALARRRAGLAHRAGGRPASAARSRAGVAPPRLWGAGCVGGGARSAGGRAARRADRGRRSDCR